MGINIDDITQNPVVKKLQRGANLLLMNKKGMYNCLEAVQEYFNRLPETKFNGVYPYEIDMAKKMKELGFDIN